jgi:hypothetical protein
MFQPEMDTVLPSASTGKLLFASSSSQSTILLYFSCLCLFATRGSCMEKELHQFTLLIFSFFVVNKKNSLYLHVHFLNDNAIIRHDATI